MVVATAIVGYALVGGGRVIEREQRKRNISRVRQSDSDEGGMSGITV